MKENKIIKTENFILKPAIKDIIKYWLKYPREGDINKMYGGNYKNLKPKNIKQAENWFNSLCNSNFAWSINQVYEVIGITKLTNYDDKEKSIFYSIGFFSSQFLNQGYGTEITKAIINFIFDYLELELIKLHVLEYNTRAIRCYEKAGFKKKKIIKDSLKLYGESYNDIEMICSKTWPKHDRTTPLNLKKKGLLFDKDVLYPGT